MSEFEKKELEEKKAPDALQDDQVEQVAGGTGDGSEKGEDEVKTWNNGILLPEIP